MTTYDILWLKTMTNWDIGLALFIQFLQLDHLRNILARITQQISMI